MNIHLYMTCYRTEALIASHLAPAEFGTYMAVGTQKLTMGQLMFFEINPELKSDYFDLERARRECVAHPDGKPKCSLYISIYRVMEHIALPDYRTLYLTTRDGKVLGIDSAPYSAADEKQESHLYQELAPVSPLIASSLPASAFVRFITDPKNPVHMPRIFFADLRVDRDTTGGLAGYLPYSHPRHIESCMRELDQGHGKKTKTVDRDHSMEFFYRVIKRGLYLGDQTDLKFYPFPSLGELDDKYHHWWRLASME